MKLSHSLIRRTLTLSLTIAGAMLPQVAQAQYSSPVRITNTTTQSVPVKDMDHGARQPVLLQSTVDFYDGSYYPHLSASNMYTVPANKRLVLEYYSAEIPALLAQRVRAFILTSSAGKSPVVVYLPLALPISIDPFASEGSSIGAGLMRVYCDPGATVHLSVSRNAPAGDNTAGNVTLSGYLVDLLP